MNDVKSGRERVLQQARDLFIERGYADVSMQQIANAAGLRKASIYHHFRDKCDLFTQVALSEMQRFRQSIELRIGDGGTFQEQLEELAFAQFDIFRSDVVQITRDFQQHVPEECHGEVHQELERLLALYTRVFERAHAAGKMRGIEPRTAALLFFHMVMGWSKHGLEEPCVLPAEPRLAARTVTSILLHGVASPSLERDGLSSERCPSSSD